MAASEEKLSVTSHIARHFGFCALQSPIAHPKNRYGNLSSIFDSLRDVIAGYDFLVFVVLLRPRVLEDIPIPNRFPLLLDVLFEFLVSEARTVETVTIRRAPSPGKAELP